MPKIREGQYMPAKKGDTFFTRPKKSKFRTDAHYSAGEQSFMPSQSGGADFFVKPNTNKARKTSNQNIQESTLPKPEKKPFDKKKYRLKTYSKKYKLQQWEEKRKTAILRGYYRNVKEDEPKFDVKSIYEQHKNDIDSDNDNADDRTNEENENNLNTSLKETAPRNSKEKKNKAFKKAYQEFERIKEEKQKKREEMAKKKSEREEALQAYKKKKAEKYKKLSRKTKRGQPIMKDRIEMLLEKIQRSVKE